MSETTSIDIIHTRQQLRIESLARRDRMSSSERKDFSRIIIDRLKSEIEAGYEKTDVPSGIRTPDPGVRDPLTFLHCYISFRSEVETRTFIEETLACGVRIVVPVVEELDGNQFLVHTEIKGLSELRQGAFGLEEPVERIPSLLDALGAVIVPIAAFDRSGTRLGYGKGFYDRFLHGLPRAVLRIGLAFSTQEVAHIPILPHDEPLDCIITEREIIRAEPSTSI
ncbi:MAG TPA: 5-formyltetrahydrofolate cyclo-ligase [Candidatus Kapabacteria bacterium]|jgi:5-formyltetrahydrofolate cyclo-ligase|nr:5-formyltetrahydrofolate cyclo-ligase [Candidatus Kapabacteria bacterium]